MDKQNDPQHQAAEYIRKAYRHLRWAANNLAAYYELVRPADMPPIEDPNQLNLFEQNERTGI